MNAETRWAVGIGCRWTVLGLAGLAVAAAAYIALSAAGAAGGETAKVICSDGVAWAGRPGHLFCYVPRPLPPFGGTLLMGGLPGRQKQFAGLYFSASDLRVVVVGAPVGESNVEIWGVPFRDSEFCRREARLVVAPERKRMIFCDALLAAEVMKSQPELWARCHRAMAGKGQLVFIHPGPADEFERFRSEARARKFAEPVVCSFEDPPGNLHDLFENYEDFFDLKRNPSLALVVTGSEVTAYHALYRGLNVDWIGGKEGGRIGKNAKLKIFSNLPDFMDSLAGW